MTKVVSLPIASPLIGTWGALDEGGTTVEYAVSLTPSGFSVKATDTYDGESGQISQVKYADAVLSFVVTWSTGRTCECRMQPGTKNQAQFTFSYTENEHLQRRAT